MVYLPFNEALDAQSLMAFMPGPVIDTDADSPIRSVCRRIDGRLVPFAFNFSCETYEGTFRFRAPGGAMWDPATGIRRPPADPRTVQVVLKPPQGFAFTRDLR